MTGTDVLKESIRCQCSHCKEEAMAHEIVALRAERDALVRAIDEHCVTALNTTFERGGDAKQAIHHLMFWSQGVGEYFAKQAIDDLTAERDALRAVTDAMVDRACVARVGAYNWQGSGESEREAMRKVLTAALAVQPTVCHHLWVRALTVRGDYCANCGAVRSSEESK